MKRDIDIVNDKPNELHADQEDDEDEDEDVSMINVDFEFFDLNKKVDFHALNTLLKQLLGPDAIDFELGAIADLILEKPIGSTVKVDGEESDPYAVLTAINLNKNKSHEELKKLVDYFLSKSKQDQKSYATLNKLLAEGAKSQTAFLFSERLINMPVEVSPPLYRILSEELTAKSAPEDDFTFDNYVVLSKSYTEISSKLDDEDDRPKKKGKSSKPTKEIFYFHAEDEILIKYASHRVQFQYSHELPESDSKRAFHDFGIKPTGELLILTKAQLGSAVLEMQDTFPF
ncbi:Putative uncharacterized protein [Taphrina deformans PYCC 5710]|uniref:Protein BCP1 n=1 Tax=Taphrina deformans (strain PYCC 5710 / ATCC 11124 / CBS 356.35 / IMI 108563 / JCM 9778 / NBRC 8474) TaxID=1097556 RepID=R4X835_TAPDE|nr:Putative uncharacterized protein [Taphrina deformans PYCC 5710]|eukprot:CCG81624.1 Putative uncharacterized protein [Taphrina deformans PYCC 5710]